MKSINPSKVFPLSTSSTAASYEFFCVEKGVHVLKPRDYSCKYCKTPYSKESFLIGSCTRCGAPKK